MKILLTGANGYVGKRLLPALLEEGHDVILLTRFSKVPVINKYKKKVSYIHADLMNPSSLSVIPTNIDIVYYLVHSMDSRTKRLVSAEKKAAQNFIQRINQTKAKQIIFLSGIGHDKKLSHHLKARHKVEDVLMSSKVSTTILRCGIIIGSGSRSFEIIRELIEKLPLMIAPRWINNYSDPIAIYDVIDYLVKVLNNPKCLNKRFEIGGPTRLTFKEMMIGLAKIRGLKRVVITLPFLNLKLSSYWLHLVTSSNYSLAKYLVMSLKYDLICRDNSIQEIIPKKLYSYEESIEQAFSKIEQNAVLSSWKDAWKNPKLKPNLQEYIQVPKFGCFIDHQSKEITNPDLVLNSIFKIGGETGWYSYDFLWIFRGWLDKLVGGVGLRRGRRHPTEIQAGESLDLWRVMVASRKEKRLLLFAEMKLPGEAWLEFKITKENDCDILTQKATFRPKGIFGRLYWYISFPFHLFVFKGMISNLIKDSIKQT